MVFLLLMDTHFRLITLTFGDFWRFCQYLSKCSVKTKQELLNTKEDVCFDTATVLYDNQIKFISKTVQQFFI